MGAGWLAAQAVVREVVRAGSKLGPWPRCRHLGLPPAVKEAWALWGAAATAPGGWGGALETGAVVLCAVWLCSRRAARGFWGRQRPGAVQLSSWAIWAATGGLAGGTDLVGTVQTAVEGCAGWFEEAAPQATVVATQGLAGLCVALWVLTAGFAWRGCLRRRRVVARRWTWPARRCSRWVSRRRHLDPLVPSTVCRSRLRNERGRAALRLELQANSLRAWCGDRGWWAMLLLLIGASSGGAPWAVIGTLALAAGTSAGWAARSAGGVWEAEATELVVRDMWRVLRKDAHAHMLLAEGVTGSKEGVVLGPRAMQGGDHDMVDEDAWGGVDELLEGYGAKRCPNAATRDCLFVALHGPTHPGPLDIARMRQELAARAGSESVKPQLSRLLKSAGQAERYRDGLAKTARGDHLALHLAAGAWDTVIVVVSGGPHPLIRVDPPRLKKGQETQRTRVIAFASDHYEAVTLGHAQAQKMRDAAVHALLGPDSWSTAAPECPAEVPDSTPIPLGVAPELLFCPMTACAGSALRRHKPFSSKASLREHVSDHVKRGEELPPGALRVVGMRQCVICAKVMSAQAQDTCLQCRKRVQPRDVPARRERVGQELTDEGRLPSLEEIHTARVAVSLSVPEAVLRPAAEVLVQALWDVAADKTRVTAWLRLFLVPKVLLRSYRGGKAKQKKARAARLEAITLWRAGKVSELWRCASASGQGAPREVQSPPTWEERERAVVQAARQGRLSTAMARTRSAGLAPASDATLATLRALHPAAEPPTIAKERRTEPADASPTDVFKALRGLPKGTGAGPSGLRADHLRALTQVEGVDVLQALTAVVNILRRGEAPPEIARHLAGASLVALPKPTGGVRPIAVGETLRRLVAKTLVAEVREKVGKLLLKGKQVGVAVDGGLDAATAVVRDYASRHKGTDRILVKIDYENAFNTVNRQAFLDAVRSDLPELAAWVEWCYAHPTALVYREHIILSEHGVQQGDPLGPLLFSLAIRKLTEDIARMPGLEGTIWYLDDGTLMGPPKAVGAAFAELEKRSAALGLKVSRRKCEVISLGGHTVAAIREVGLDVAASQKEEEVRMKLLQQNFEFLGAPVGDAAYCEAVMDRKLEEKFLPCLRELHKVRDAQVAMTLLRHCEGFCKVVFAMRAIGYKGREYLKKYDP